MKNRFLLVAGCLTLITGRVYSAPILVHQGKSDPATEGWNYNTYGGAGGANGPVGPGEVEVASEDAWKFVDPGTSTRPTYESPRLTPSEAASLNANSWELTVRMSSPESSTTTQSRGFEFITPGAPEVGKFYRVYITTNASLEQTVTVYNLTGTQPAGTISPGFHTYRLVATPDVNTLFNVSLFIDDAVTPAVTNIPGFSKNTASLLSFISPNPDSSFIRVGSFNAGAASTLYFSHASLNIVPEPAAAVVAGIALAGLLCARFFRPHTKRRRVSK